MDIPPTEYQLVNRTSADKPNNKNSISLTRVNYITRILRNLIICILASTVLYQMTKFVQRIDNLFTSATAAPQHDYTSPSSELDIFLPGRDNATMLSPTAANQHRCTQLMLFFNQGSLRVSTTSNDRTVHFGNLQTQFSLLQLVYLQITNPDLDNTFQLKQAGITVNTTTPSFQLKIHDHRNRLQTILIAPDTNTPKAVDAFMRKLALVARII